ncbi:SBBP repeat-containing protein [Fluviicola chungangensis]|nr:SBBP repeat-containing protein [Fluviicola chungangensis]
MYQYSKNILLSLAFLAIAKFNSAQTFEWVNTVGGTDYYSGKSIDTDASGNVYVTGQFDGTAGVPGATVPVLPLSGEKDSYVAKLDSSGNFLWTRGLGGSEYVLTNSIAVDALGNSYIAGHFTETADFNPGPGIAMLTSASDLDGFIVKLDASGNFVWVKQFAGTDRINVNAIVLDASGNIYTTGTFRATADFDPGTGTSMLTAASIGEDIFISKLDPAGNFVWVKQQGGTGTDVSYAIAVDASGNVHTTGSFYGTADFDPGTGTAGLTVAGFRDVFVSKLDASGNFVWAKQLGGTTMEDGYGIAVDAQGNVYTTGSYYGSGDYDPGPGVFNLAVYANDYDVFISKLDASGNFVWAKKFGNNSLSDDFGYSIALDASNNVYVTGVFEGTTDFDPGPGIYTLPPGGAENVFIAKLDHSGNFVWAGKMGGAQLDAGYSIAIDPFWNIYTTGIFDATVDFDPGPGVHNITSFGGYQAFIHKMSQCDNTGTDVQSSCDPYTWIDGNTYASSNNTATYMLTNSSGCDSLVTLNLSINTSAGTDVQSACSPYTWIDGNTYVASNDTATYILTNAAGCDSVVTLHFTLNNPTTGTDVQTACDSYTWIDGNTYTLDNNTATYVLTNTAGCDSVVTLNLTIYKSSPGTIDVQTACGSYTWLDGNTYTASNNTATYTLANAAGCDSVVTLNLTITSLPNVATSTTGITITANNSTASYQWLDCNTNTPILGADNQSFTPTANGNYAVELTQNGCVDTSACVNITTVGIIENDFGIKLEVYPNPSDGSFSVDMGDNFHMISVEISDLNGRVLRRETLKETGSFNLSLEESSGVYLLTVQSEERKAVIRLIKK